MRLILKSFGFALLISIWTFFYAILFPCLIGVLFAYSLLTGEWNWRELLQQSHRERYVVLPSAEMRLLMEEQERHFIRVVLARLEKNKCVVNWRRDGF